VSQITTSVLQQIERYLSEQGVIFSNQVTDATKREVVYTAVNQLTRNVNQTKQYSLASYDFDRICYHLGYNIASVSPADYARLLEACNNIPGEFYYYKIVDQLRRCEDAEVLTELANNRPTSRQEIILGDATEVLNRSISIQDKATVARIWRENYLYELDRLSHVLHVVNYRDPVIAVSRFRETEGDFIQGLPGPQDPACSDNFYFYAKWH
jgi:hypothetical protein